jgi:hypothetical protein
MLEKEENGRTCSMHGEGVQKDAYRVLMETPEGKRPLRRRRSRRVDNILIDISEGG